MEKVTGKVQEARTRIENPQEMTEQEAFLMEAFLKDFPFADQHRLLNEIVRA